MCNEDVKELNINITSSNGMFNNLVGYNKHWINKYIEHLELYIEIQDCFIKCVSRPNSEVAIVIVMC